MSDQSHKYQLRLIEARQSIDSYMRQFDNYQYDTQRFHLLAITRFVVFLQAACGSTKECLHFTDNKILEWMKFIANTIHPQHAHETILSINRFLQALESAGMISENPMTAIHKRFGKRGWKGINQALQFDNLNVSLESLRVEPRFSGLLGNQLQNYLRLIRSAGTKHETTEMFFAGFNRFACGRNIDSAEGVTTKMIVEWIGGMTCGQASCRAKTLALNRFFKNLCSLGTISQNPITPKILESISTSDRTFEPYIFSYQQIRAILEETKKLTPSRNFKLKPQAVYTIISLLYTLGLRVSEALHLHIRDVDFEQGTLFIRKTKFYKERIVPFGPKLSKCLMDYLDLRRTVFIPAKKDDPLFVARRRTHMSTGSIGTIFRNTLNRTRINAGTRQRQPRLHDLRHSFAVHRLLRWYEQGENVQSKLMLLSTFMGHVEIYSTQVYLTIIESLLNEANKRFYREFGAYFEREVSL